MLLTQGRFLPERMYSFSLKEWSPNPSHNNIESFFNSITLLKLGSEHTESLDALVRVTEIVWAIDNLKVPGENVITSKFYNV